MITRSFGANGQFEVTDWTQELLVVPNQWGLINQLGIFAEEGVTQNTVTFEEITTDGALLIDRVRGERAQVGKDAARKVRAFPIPHFPADDYISPADLQGKRAYGAPNDAENLAAVRARKMARIRQNHAWTLEYARAQAIVTGNVYAPSGTVSQNWYTEFGVSQASVDFTFGTTTAEVLDKINTVIATMQDNIGNGQVLTGAVMLCSPEFFQKLILHPSVKAAYQYYTSTQEPLRSGARAGAGTSDIRREFYHGGLKFVEVRDSYAGNRLIPAGEAYAVPLGTDAFVTHYGPANKFDFVNTIGEQLYMFEYASQKGDKIEIETESNFINVVRRPAAVIKGMTSN